ncbi:MAG: 3'(2'),5'-bisphosphate nucleotidase CysQ [Haliscomenobacter sp.]|nr:3'(2'),5'-bisphosphate nucleotidase CysQ [Haliscomenobacter sp.]
MDKNGLLESVKLLAREAGAAIMEIYQRPDFNVVDKSDHSPLTDADQASNQIICDGLMRLFPKFPIISEENRETPYEERKTYEYCWLVDPLDGTKEFIRRNGDFTVNIALVKGQSLEMGVVFIPATEELYWAWRGMGAFWELGGIVRPLKTASFRLTDAGLGVVASRSHMTPETEMFISSLNQPSLLSRGSALKFLLLAKGEAHLYPRLAPTMEWDTGAAQMILEEAGGSVIEAGTDLPLLYNKENLLNPHFIAFGSMNAG